MGYDFWWFGLAGLTLFVGFIGLVSSLFDFFKGDKRMVLPGVVFGLIFGAAIYGFVHLHHSYVVHYQDLQVRETKAIQNATKKKPLGVVDQGQDPQFSNLRDVLILTPGGRQEYFYYNPATGKATYGGKELNGG